MFHFDDFELILGNSQVVGEGFDYRIFLNHYGGRPLTLWTFYLNYIWSGTDPGAYHVINFFLHFLVACLLFQTAVFYRFDLDVAFLGAAIFLVHPIQTQAVNYIWSRSLLLMSVWIFISILTYKKKSIMGLVAFQFAIWSRAEALILTPILLAQNRRRWFPLTLIALINLVGIGWGIHQENSPEFGLNYHRVAEYWWAQPWIFLRYMSWFFWPFGLSIDHDFNTVGSILEILPSVIFQTAILFFLKFNPRSVSSTGFFLGLGALMLLPSAIFPNPDILNESRTYLAVAALSLLAATLILRLTRKKIKRKAIVGSVVLIPLILLTQLRNETWRSDVAIWEDAVKKAPGKSRTHYNLGVALAKTQQLERARESFLQASRLNPFDDLSYAGLGYCAEIQGNTDLAYSYYLKAVQLVPENRYAQEALARLSEPSY